MKSNVPDFQESVRKANREAWMFVSAGVLAGCILIVLAGSLFSAWRPRVSEAINRMMATEPPTPAPASTALPHSIALDSTATPYLPPTQQLVPTTNLTQTSMVAAEWTSTPTSGPTPTPALADLSILSGPWSGTETVVDLGSCNLGTSTRLSLPVVIRLYVDDDGHVKVEAPMTMSWRTRFPYALEGEIRPDLSLSLALSPYVGPGADDTRLIKNYEGRIQIRGNTATLEMQATEEWLYSDCVLQSQFSVERRLAQ